MDFIGKLEQELNKLKDPDFTVGDTVKVHYKIREGEKSRTQIFEGTVIAVKGRGARKNFIVRRIVQGEGVERTFPMYSPNIEKIEISRKGQVRRSKLYYLRQRVGKATKVREMLEGVEGASVAETGSPAAKTAAAESPSPEKK